MTPNNIDRYEVRGEIGRGGMATVLKGYDPRFKRDVAIKLLPREFLHDPQFRARFQREAQTIAALEHPAIVPVYDFGDADGQLYLVMRLMTGGSLAEQLEKGPLSITETARIFERLAPALDSAHALGIIHRDLKPANILFDQWNNPYLSDFGIAKLVAGSSTALTATGGLVGTPAYMSPEQVRGVEVLDGRSDIYAMGIILFQMLTGQLPYNANTPIGLAFMHVTEPVPNILDSNTSLPHAYQSVIEQAMAKERGARPRTTVELADTVSGLALGVDDNRTILDSEAKETIVEPMLDQFETEQLETAEPKQPNTTNFPLTALEDELHQDKWKKDDSEVKALVGALPKQVLTQKDSIFRRIPAWGWAVLSIASTLLIYSVSFLFQGEDGVNEVEITPNKSVAVVEYATMPPTETIAPSSTPSPSASVVISTPTIELIELPTETHTPKPTNTHIPRPTSIATETPIPKPQIQVLYSSANVREGPGTNFEVVRVLTQGDTVDVLAKTDDGTWYNVTLDDGTFGWLAASAVEEIKDMEMVSVAETIPAVQVPAIQVTNSGWAEECNTSWRWLPGGFPQMYPSLHSAENSTVYGEGPITFRWPACDLPYGYAYRLTVHHIGKGYYSTSYESTTNSLTVQLPIEKFGAWEWEIEAIQSNGDTATFTDSENNRVIDVGQSSIGFFYDPYSSP